jgi:hypothetical protein
VAIGVLVLALVTFANPNSAGGGSAPNPMNATAIGLLWAYRAAVLVAIAGGVSYVIRLVRGVRKSLEGSDAAPGDNRAVSP